MTRAFEQRLLQFSEKQTLPEAVSATGLPRYSTVRAGHRLGDGKLALLRQISGPGALECPCGAATSQLWGGPCDLESPWPGVVRWRDRTRFWEIE